MSEEKYNGPKLEQVGPGEFKIIRPDDGKTKNLALGLEKQRKEGQKQRELAEQQVRYDEAIAHAIVTLQMKAPDMKNPRELHQAVRDIIAQNPDLQSNRASTRTRSPESDILTKLQKEEDELHHRHDQNMLRDLGLSEPLPIQQGDQLIDQINQLGGYDAIARRLLPMLEASQDPEDDFETGLAMLGIPSGGGSNHVSSIASQLNIHHPRIVHLYTSGSISPNISALHQEKPTAKKGPRLAGRSPELKRRMQQQEAAKAAARSAETDQTTQIQAPKKGKFSLFKPSTWFK